MAKNWVKSNCPDVDDTVLYLGMTADELHRLERSRRFWSPYRVESPIASMSTFGKSDMIMEVRMDGLDLPELYELGFPHNNCGGFCIKAGQAHFLHLLKTLPEKYDEVEKKEEEMRALLGDVSILRDRTGGTTKTLPLKVLRQRNRAECNTLDWGGCGCFGDTEE